jgi:hypothetical protein
MNKAGMKVKNLCERHNLIEIIESFIENMQNKKCEMEDK